MNLQYEAYEQLNQWIGKTNACINEWMNECMYICMHESNKHCLNEYFVFVNG